MNGLQAARVRRPPTGLAAAAIVLISALGPTPAPAQVNSVTYQHTCADCHLRDHDTASGRRPMADSRVVARAMTRLIPGLGIQSANCLECHSTEDQRVRRAADSPDEYLPVGEGLYLGLSTLRSHPLGTERRTREFSDPFRVRDPLSADGERSGMLPGLGDEDAAVDCASCHDPHQYDLTLESAGGEMKVCLSCHDPTSYAFNAHITPTCGSCHKQHGAPGPDLLREMDAEALCAACHEGSGRMAVNPVDPSLRGPPAHVDLRPGSCISCHRIHGDPGGM